MREDFSVPSAQYYSGGVVSEEAVREAIRHGGLLKPCSGKTTVDEILSHIDSAQVTLTASDVFLVPEERTSARLNELPSKWRTHRREKAFVLSKGESVFCRTRERLCLPYNVVAISSNECRQPNSDVAIYAGRVLPPEFCGTLEIEVKNVGLESLTISVGDVLATVTFVSIIR